MAKENKHKMLTHHNLSNGVDWHIHNKYSAAEIDAIKDPERGNTKKAPTSIPSPFANIDNVRVAFEKIADNKDLKGTPIEERLVSQALDIGEMLFNRDKFPDKLKIITWDKEHDLRVLKDSTNQGHRRLGEALALFLSQDAETYNFNDLDKLYLVEYDYKIIGGTSPSTLFFSSMNDLSFASVRMPNNDILFDDEFCPLYLRDSAFQKMMYAVKKVTVNFGKKFGGLSSYMDASLLKLEAENKGLYGEIKTLADGENAFHYLTKECEDLDASTTGERVFVLAAPIKKKKTAGTAESDFFIKPTREITGKVPLVLQPGHDGRSRIGQPLKYFGHPFDTDIKIPYHNPEPKLEQRFLPGFQGIRYPHILVSDFLEPILIRTVYPINKSQYFNGNIDKQPETKGFLIPIKKKFFKYFNTEDLMGMLPNSGKRMFELSSLANNAIKATLRIPICDGKENLTFERIYHVPVNSAMVMEVNESKNEGVIMESKFGVNIFPFYKLENRAEDVQNHYRIFLANLDDDTNAIKLNVHKEGGGSLKPNRDVYKRRDKKSGESLETNYYCLDEEFSFLEYENGIAKGLIIPRLRSVKEGNKAAKVAIDFGTTNTHVELILGGKTPMSLEITEDDMQVGVLHDPVFAETTLFGDSGSIELANINAREFFPRLISANHQYKFPQRTVVAEANNASLHEVDCLSQVNIPFSYEKIPVQADNQVAINTNLKWSSYENGKIGNADSQRLKAFIEEIVFVTRNKILLNGGNLHTTRITWFYPSNMLPARRNELEKIYKQEIEKYFTPGTKFNKMFESLAPFYFFEKAHNRSAHNAPAVTVDIGGGTTDITVFTQNKPNFQTAFQFAANNIWGSPEAADMRQLNGFVRRYLDDYMELLRVNQLYNLAQVQEEIIKRNFAPDLVSFWFSIEKHKDVLSKGRLDGVSFTERLSQDGDMKLVFLIFYEAIIYHIARMMKFKQLAPPRYLYFTGNGSGILNLIDNNINLTQIQKLTQEIFKRVMEKDASDLEIVQVNNPKEITCKGGLMAEERDEDVEDYQYVHPGLSDQALNNNNLRYKDLGSVEVLDSVIDEVSNFVKLVISLNESISYSRYFAIKANQLEDFKALMEKDLKEKLMAGIGVKLSEMRGNESEELQETLFFLPISAKLQELALQISMSDE